MMAKLNESSPDCTSFSSSESGDSARSCSTATCWNCDVIVDLTDISFAPLAVNIRSRILSRARGATGAELRFAQPPAQAERVYRARRGEPRYNTDTKR